MRRAPLNNRQRAALAARERMDAVTIVKIPRLGRLPSGRYNAVPMRYLSHAERRDLLARATSPLIGD